MTPDEIAELSTSQQGNIVNWNTLQSHGVPHITTLAVSTHPSKFSSKLLFNLELGTSNLTHLSEALTSQSIVQQKIHV